MIPKSRDIVDLMEPLGFSEITRKSGRLDRVSGSDLTMYCTDRSTAIIYKSSLDYQWLHRTLERGIEAENIIVISDIVADRKNVAKLPKQYNVSFVNYENLQGLANMICPGYCQKE